MFVLTHIDTPDAITDPCPLLRPDQVGWFMAQEGLTTTNTGYSTSIFNEAEVTDGSPGVQCGIDIEAWAAAPDPAAPYAVLLDAFTTSTPLTIDQIADGVRIGTCSAPVPPMSAASSPGSAAPSRASRSVS